MLLSAQASIELHNVEQLFKVFRGALSLRVESPPQYLITTQVFLKYSSIFTAQSHQVRKNCALKCLRSVYNGNFLFRMEQKPIKTYLDLRDRNVEEKNLLLKDIMSEWEEEEKQARVPAVSRPTKRKRKVPSPAVSLPARKSRRLMEKPGPAPTYQEDDDGEARGRSRKPGSGGARARSQQQQLRPRRPIITYKEEELEPLDNLIFCGPCGLPKSPLVV